jgi:hypothetical protein
MLLAAISASSAAIRAALTQWTEDFNAGRNDKVCDLFAEDARADVAGVPERDYASICEVLTRSLNDKTRRYSYAKDMPRISRKCWCSATSRWCGWSGL